MLPSTDPTRNVPVQDNLTLRRETLEGVESLLSLQNASFRIPAPGCLWLVDQAGE
jgi:hypothetical protein